MDGGRHDRHLERGPAARPPRARSPRSAPRRAGGRRLTAESSRLGAACAIAAGAGFGTLGIFSRLFYDAGGEEFSLLVLRFCGSFVVLAAIALLRARPVPARRDTGLSMLLGLATLGTTFCLLRGFEAASPGLVTLLFYVYPLILTVAGHLLFSEELTRARALLLALGMAGIALTVGIPDAATAEGIGWGLGAGICISVFILGSRHVMSRSVDSFQFVALAFTGALIALVPLTALIGLDRPPGDAMPHVLAVIVVSSVAPTLCFYFAVSRIGAGAAGRLATVEPVVAVALSYVVLDEAIVASQIAGGLLVVAAVAALATPMTRRLSRRSPPRPRAARAPDR